MENIFNKIIATITCIFISSCRFEGDEIKILGVISGHYFVLKEVGSVGYGLEIGYSLYNENYQIIATNCNDIYFNKDTIVYSIKNSTDSQIIGYHLIIIDSNHRDGLADEPLQIRKKSFQSLIKRFKKTNIY